MTENVWQEFEQVQSAIELVLTMKKTKKQRHTAWNLKKHIFNDASIWCTKEEMSKTKIKVETCLFRSHRWRQVVVVDFVIIILMRQFIAAISLPTFSGIYRERPTYYLRYFRGYGTQKRSNKRYSKVFSFARIVIRWSGLSHTRHRDDRRQL